MYRKERRRKRWAMGEMWKKEGRLKGVENEKEQGKRKKEKKKKRKREERKRKGRKTKKR